MNPEVLTLDGGLRVVLDPITDSPTAAISVVLDVGARDEPDAHAGLAHLWEHMAFKGAGGRDARQIAEAIEGAGGSLNAATGYERTSYQARVLAEGVPDALGLLADLLIRPTFDPTELEREKDVVGQEILEAFDAPDDIVFERLQAVVYPGHPLGRSILGTPQTLAAIDRNVLIDNHKRHATADNTVIAIAGGYDRDHVLDVIARSFSGMPVHAQAARTTPGFAGGAVSLTRKIEQSHLAFALPGVGISHPDFYAVRVLAEALGGGMASRLFQEVREKRGLAYSIDAYADSFTDVGTLGIYAACEAAKAKDVAELCAQIVRDFIAKPDLTEVTRAKIQLKASLMFARESPMARAEQAGGQVHVYGRVLSAAELAASVEAVTCEDVTRVGSALLAQNKAAASHVGAKAGGAGADAFVAGFGV